MPPLPYLVDAVASATRRAGATFARLVAAVWEKARSGWGRAVTRTFGEPQVSVPDSGDLEVVREWQSPHWYYLKFAVESAELCRTESPTLPNASNMNRVAIEAVRYAFDTLDAATEFIHLLGLQSQLRFTPPDNWLTRYCEREWKAFSVGERIGILTFAWTGQSFWRDDKEFQLFEDLKKLRGALTHPRPAGIERRRRVTAREVMGRLEGTTAVPDGEPIILNPGHMTHGRRALATFATSPFALDSNDADQAVEILLCHLARCDEIFFGRSTTWFALNDPVNARPVPALELLRAWPRRLNAHWH